VVNFKAGVKLVSNDLDVDVDVTNPSFSVTGGLPPPINLKAPISELKV
jgi:hypothetical protein